MRQTPGLESIFKSSIAKLSFTITIGFTIILTAQAILFSYQSQRAVCEIIKAKAHFF